MIYYTIGGDLKNKIYLDKYHKYKLKYIKLKEAVHDYQNNLKDENSTKCDLEKFNIQVIDDFLTKEECEIIIELARPLLKRSTLIGKEEINSTRTSSGVFINYNKHPILKNIVERVSEITKIPIENQEDIQVINYQKGEYYKQHYDACTDKTEECKIDNEKGIRKNTFFIYLNNVEEGGYTGFPNISKKVIPKLGRAVSWNNIIKLDDTYHNDPCSLHIGIKPNKGEKWALTVWSRI